MKLVGVIENIISVLQLIIKYIKVPKKKTADLKFSSQLRSTQPLAQAICAVAVVAKLIIKP